MGARMMGVPFVVWGLICLIIAVVWIVVWPADKVQDAAGWRFLVIRWGHALTWLLLAVAAFLAASGAQQVAKPISQLALVVYLAFLATTYTDIGAS